MVKKLLCLLLVLVMALPFFSSCKKKQDVIEQISTDASRLTTTLNMWVMTGEEGVDEEQAKAINDAINNITKAKFKTKLNIKYVKESEYYAKVEEAFAANAAAIEAEKQRKREERDAIRQGIISADSIKSDEVVGDVTVYNEYGVPELKYPEAKDYQVDIFFIGSFEKYRSYADQNLLIALDGKLENTAIKLRSYLNDELLEGARYDGSIFGIPNNGTIGEYTYLLLDETLMNRFGYTATDFETASLFDADCRKFLDLVFAAGEGIYPIYSEDGTVDIPFVHYWNYGEGTNGEYTLYPDSFSLFGGVFDNTYQHGQQIGYSNVLADMRYMQLREAKTYYENTAGYITQDANAAAAARIVKGGYELRAQLEAEGYTVLTVAAPRVTDETVFSSMFAIGGYTADDARAMEIITYLNTNVEFRNLLQYGIEGVNYTKHTKVVGGKERTYVTMNKDNKYVLDVAKTGNMFLAYPCGEENIEIWEYGKKQNLDAIGYPTLGMFFDLRAKKDGQYQISEQNMKIIAAVSQKLEAYLDAVTTTEGIRTIYENASSFQLNASAMATYLLSLVGDDVTYTLGTEVKTVTESDLAAALAYATDDNREAETMIKSPLALYLNWRDASGLADAFREN